MPHNHTVGAAFAHGRLADAAARRSLDLPLAYCPECGMPAWVEWQDPAGSDGSSYVKLRCFARHWFLLLQEPRAQA